MATQNGNYVLFSYNFMQKYKKKRIVMWKRALENIKEVDKRFLFSWDNICRKLLNFM